MWKCAKKASIRRSKLLQKPSFEARALSSIETAALEKAANHPVALLVVPAAANDAAAAATKAAVTEVDVATIAKVVASDALAVAATEAAANAGTSRADTGIGSDSGSTPTTREKLLPFCFRFDF